MISLTVAPSVLYLANHKMVEIAINVTATDDRDAQPLIDLVSITSNEGADWKGDGHTSNDIMVQNGHVFLPGPRTSICARRSVLGVGGGSRMHTPIGAINGSSFGVQAQSQRHGFAAVAPERRLCRRTPRPSLQTCTTR